MDIQDILQLERAGSVHWTAYLLSMAGSLLTSAFLLWCYEHFYERQHVGSGVQRVFLLGGVSLTALLLAIQFSLPLAIGVFGAFSFVRFTSNIKDPAEIGFLLVLIAGSVGLATFNYWLVASLYAAVSVVFYGRYFLDRYLPGEGQSQLIVSVDNPDFGPNEGLLADFLSDRLRGVKLLSISTLDGHVNFHYRFNKTNQLDWGPLVKQISEIVTPAKCYVHVM